MEDFLTEEREGEGGCIIGCGPGVLIVLFLREEGKGVKDESAMDIYSFLSIYFVRINTEKKKIVIKSHI
jgi:hypothetical protein